MTVPREQAGSPRPLLHPAWGGSNARAGTSFGNTITQINSTIKPHFLRPLAPPWQAGREEDRRLEHPAESEPLPFECPSEAGSKVPMTSTTRGAGTSPAWPRGGRVSRSQTLSLRLCLCKMGPCLPGAPRTTTASDLAFWGGVTPLDTSLALAPPRLTPDTNVGLGSEVHSSAHQP